MQLCSFLLRFLLLLLVYFFIKEVLLSNKKIIEGLDTSASDSSEDPELLFQKDSSELAYGDSQAETSVADQGDNLSALNESLTISS